MLHFVLRIEFDNKADSFVSAQLNSLKKRSRNIMEHILNSFV